MFDSKQELSQTAHHPQSYTCRDSHCGLPVPAREIIPLCCTPELSCPDTLGLEPLTSRRCCVQKLMPLIRSCALPV